MRVRRDHVCVCVCRGGILVRFTGVCKHRTPNPILTHTFAGCAHFCSMNQVLL